VRRRDVDGCPIAGALQLVGNKWTMLIVRDLAAGPKRTLELLYGLYPISSRTLVGRLREMEQDNILERRDFGGNPPRVEYSLTERGRLMLPLLDSLRRLGQALKCDDCDERFSRLGVYCDACPLKEDSSAAPRTRRQQAPARRSSDDSIVLL
jgi:DNA-binding HxlR family transcriptional regulator